MDELERVRAKIAVLTRARDSIRQLSLKKVFRSVEHRDEVYQAIVEALETLEERAEELEEEIFEEEE